MTFPRQTSRLASAAGIICALLFFSSPSAIAQGFGGRTATVSVSEASEEVLSIFTDVQGRVAAGQATAITATTNAVTLPSQNRDQKAGFFASLCGAADVIWALVVWILSASKKRVIWLGSIDVSPDQAVILC